MRLAGHQHGHLLIDFTDFFLKRENPFLLEMDRSIELCHVYCSDPFTVRILIGPLQRHLLAPLSPLPVWRVNFTWEIAAQCICIASRSQFSLLFPPSLSGSQLFSAVRRRCDRKAARWCRNAHKGGKCRSTANWKNVHTRTGSLE